MSEPQQGRQPISKETTERYSHLARKYGPGPLPLLEFCDKCAADVLEARAGGFENRRHVLQALLGLRLDVRSGRRGGARQGHHLRAGGRWPRHHCRAQQGPDHQWRLQRLPGRN